MQKAGQLPSTSSVGRSGQVFKEELAIKTLYNPSSEAARDIAMRSVRTL